MHTASFELLNLHICTFSFVLSILCSIVQIVLKLVFAKLTPLGYAYDSDIYSWCVKLPTSHEM